MCNINGFDIHMLHKSSNIFCVVWVGPNATHLGQRDLNTLRIPHNDFLQDIIKVLC